MWELCTRDDRWPHMGDSAPVPVVLRQDYLATLGNHTLKFQRFSEPSIGTLQRSSLSYFEGSDYLLAQVF